MSEESTSCVLWSHSKWSRDQFVSMVVLRSWDTRTTNSSQSQVSRKFSTKNRSYLHNWIESDLRVTCECLKLVVRHSCEQQQILKGIMVSSWLCVTLTSDARVSHNQHNPVNQSRSPTGRGENCEAYHKSLHDPRPLIFGCTTSIKPQKPGKPTCDAGTSVSRLTPIFGLFQVVKRFCMECDRGFRNSLHDLLVTATDSPGCAGCA